jgi:hypothetical protein
MNENKLSLNYKTKLNAWRNNIPNIKNADNKTVTWVGKNHKKIYKYIIESYDNLNTLKSHLSTLSSILKLLNVNEEDRKKYSDESTDYNNQNNDKLKKQIMTPSRAKNFVTFSAIEHKRDEYKNKFENNKDDNKTNLIYLILCLFTYQAPIRHQYEDAEIVKKIPSTKDKNFILDDNNKYSIILNDDKVIKSHGKAIIKFDDKLNNIIYESLEAYPRKYLLSMISKPDIPLGIQNFNYILKDVFDGKRVGINIFRSSYISDKYKDPDFSIEKKDELAKEMRHSREIADLAYNKLNVKKTIDNVVK